MSKYFIQGKSPLKGELTVNGAKNLALKILPACLMIKGKTRIDNIPPIEDIKRMIEILESLDVKLEQKGTSFEVDASCINFDRSKSEVLQRIRASVMLIAPFLARFGEIYLPHPGGCTLGKRPIDFFVRGFKAFGVEVKEEDEGYYFKCRKLKATRFFFPLISVTATESLMMAAVFAEGTTLLENCAAEPEVVALARFLNQTGAEIQGAGTHTMRIKGISKLNDKGYCNIIPDRIEAGSFAILAAATQSDIKITRCEPQNLKALWALFDQMGARYELGKDFIRVYPKENLKACNVKTHEYPGFVTDLQAPMTVLLTQAQGVSMVHETIFDGRLFYTDMLNQMGAKIILCDPHRAIVNGKTDLYGKKVVSPDLRAGIAMVIAGLIAEGQTEIDNIYQIERGYANLVERLQKVGAKISKQN